MRNQMFNCEARGIEDPAGDWRECEMRSRRISEELPVAGFVPATGARKRDYVPYDG